MGANSSKPRMPKQQRGIQTKQQIIDAAMRLFSQKGFHGTNSKEIAREAGVATGCFYAYFTDKKDVFIEALKIYFDQFNSITEEHIGKLFNENIDKKYFFKELIKSFINAHSVFTDLHHELTAMYYTDPDVLKLIAEYDKASIGYILQYLKNIQTQLRVSNIETAAEVVYYSVHSVVDAIVFSEKDNEQKLIDEVTDMVEMYLFGKAT
jgi:AcrR family transcriptional regulator